MTDNGRALKRILVCCAVPNPNGNIHLGHLAGPFLSADVYARYRRLRGHTVHFQGGTDDYQSWTAAMARKLGSTPAETAARFSAAIEESCRRARIDVTHFHKPSSSVESAEMARTFFPKLYADGRLIEKTVDAPYCEACDRSLFDVYVNGICPHCGDSACGAGCEGCSSPFDSVALLEPYCTVCGEPAARRPITKLFLPLSAYQPQLEEYYRKFTANAFQRKLFHQLCDQGLPDLACTQPSAWGIPVPVERFAEQRVSPWLQMAFDHLASSQILSRKVGLEGGWTDLWTSDEVETAQFCGADTGWIFGILYPTVFFALDLGIRPISVLLPTQFYLLEDSAFSTSKGHAIWVSEFIEKTSADVVRFYCAYTGPQTERTSFRLREFVETVEDELIGVWEAWLSGLWERAGRDLGAVAPSAPEPQGEEAELKKRLDGFLKDAEAAYSAAAYSPRQAARVASELARTAARFASRAPTLADPEIRSQAIAMELAAARALALAVGPIMPNFSDQLWGALGYDRPIHGEDWDAGACHIPAGQGLRPFPQAYFPRVADLEQRMPKIGSSAGRPASTPDTELQPQAQ